MKKDILYSDAQIRRKTFISFGVFLGLSAVAARGWFYLKNLPPDHGLLGGVQFLVEGVPLTSGGGLQLPSSRVAG